MKENKYPIYYYFISVAVIYFIACSYFVLPLIQDKVIQSGDIVNHRGVAKEIRDYRKEYNKEPLWTDRVFSGMPAYLISTKYNGNKIKIIHKIFTFGIKSDENFIPHKLYPAILVFLYLLGFLIALWLFGVDPWLSIAGAVAYAFSSYFFIIIAAGHFTKVIALGYMPPIIAGVYAAYNGRHLVGSAAFTLFLALQLFINHLQITYYTMIIVLIYIIFKFVISVRDKTFVSFLKPSVLLLIGVLLAVGSNFGRLLTTYEYGKYSIRGKSELTSNLEDKTTGLDRSYVTQWSYGIGETLTLFIPNFKGGPSSGAFGPNSKTAKYIARFQREKQAKKTARSMPSYWGKQPFTSGPVYAGAVMVFLFVLGLFVVKGHVKYWLIAITIISIVLSWGKNIPWLTNFLLDYLPGYNKFRTVSMALIIAEFSIPLMGILALREIFSGNVEIVALKKYLLNTTIITGGLCVLFILFAGVLFNFSSPADQMYNNPNFKELISMFMQDRKNLLILDSLRSLIFVGLTAGVLYIYASTKFEAWMGALFIGFIILADMWPVDARYLNYENFVTKRKYKDIITPTPADIYILKYEQSRPENKANEYRVLNLASRLDGILRDSRTSYFHNSLGGYSGAKMRRYQELFDHVFYDELIQLQGALSAGITQEVLNKWFSQQVVLNMLNTRYIIYNYNSNPLFNNAALGNAWFVNDYLLVDSADLEIKALGRIGLNDSILLSEKEMNSPLAVRFPDTTLLVRDASGEIVYLKKINPANEAVIDKRFEPQLSGLKLVADTTAKIELVSYMPNKLRYRSSAKYEQLAVFSEIYYDKGWDAYVDGKLTPYLRADYVLRAMRVPPGTHDIEFRFKPESYYKGEKVSLASSLLIIILAVGVFIREVVRRTK
jgi:hypothetical protein